MYICFFFFFFFSSRRRHTRFKCDWSSDVCSSDLGWQEARQLAQATLGQVDLVILGHLDDPATDPNRADPGPPALLAVEGHGHSLLKVDLQFPVGTQSSLFLAQGEAGKQAELKDLDARIARLREQARAASVDMRPLYAE